MYKVILSILVFMLASSCSQTDRQIEGSVQKNKVQSYFYDSLTIPEFISKLALNHQENYFLHNSEDFHSVFTASQLDANDPDNRNIYCELNLLHDLFTSKSPSNGSRGDILDIPYFWHWVSPNPRYGIYLRENHMLLKDQKPPLGFEKYKNYADVDRTPDVFLIDMFSEKPKYYSACCDTFSTFGWCSERCHLFCWQIY
jgi:hypothetical protein